MSVHYYTYGTSTVLLTNTLRFPGFLIVREILVEVALLILDCSETG